MSLVERVKRIIEEKADGHHHALMHLAEEIQNSAGGRGLPTDVVNKLKSDLGEKIDNHMEAIGGDMAKARAEFSGRLAAIEEQLAAAAEPKEGAPKPAPEAGAESQS